jgi:putative ABC transport system substrate-binding protein
MRRRDFLEVFVGLAVWPSLAKAGRSRPVIGYLSSRSPNDSAQIVAAFRKGLAEAGYAEGRDATVEYRWAEGDYERLPVLAADLVRLRPAVLIAAGGEPSALAAKAATGSIPIVCSLGGDPVKVGLAKSLNRPGGNVTGISLLATELESKRLGLLHELAPRAKVIGILVDRNFQESETQTLEATQAARQIGRPIEIVYAKNDVELDIAFERLTASGVDALLVCAAPFFDTRRERIVAFETKQRIPAIYQFRDYAAGGGLMSYGIRPSDSYLQVGAYAGRILNGASPSELPIVRPTTFEFVINLKSAGTMGIEIPTSLLTRADEVIE